MLEVMPPILLVSDSAENLFYGMFNHPFFVGIRSVLQAIRETASDHVTLFELDGATGNERLFNYFLSIGSPGKLIDMIKCRNHQTNLIEGTLLMASNLPSRNMLSMFFSLTHFLRNGGQFVRLKQAALQWVADSATVLRNTCRDPDEERLRVEHACELRDFLECTDRLRKSIESKSKSKSGEEHDYTQSELQRRLDDFFATWTNMLMCSLFFVVRHVNVMWKH